MKSCIFLFLLVSYGALAIRFTDMKANEKGRIDSVIVLKTLDAEFISLDMDVFPNLPHVPRWAEEVLEHKPVDEFPSWIGHYPAMAEWFDHKPGEDIMGKHGIPAMVRSYVEDPFWNGEETAGKLFTMEKHGKTLFIQLLIMEKHGQQAHCGSQ